MDTFYLSYTHMLMILPKLTDLLGSCQGGGQVVVSAVGDNDNQVGPYWLMNMSFRISPVWPSLLQRSGDQTPQESHRKAGCQAQQPRRTDVRLRPTSGLRSAVIKPLLTGTPTQSVRQQANQPTNPHGRSDIHLLECYCSEITPVSLSHPGAQLIR